MTHPQDTYIRGWMAGRPTQFRDGNLWFDLKPYATVEKMPHFYRDGEYRFKPIDVRFRVGLECTGGEYRPFIVHDLEGERVRAARPTFMEWVTDWVEVAS